MNMSSVSFDHLANKTLLIGNYYYYRHKRKILLIIGLINKLDFFGTAISPISIDNRVYLNFA